MMASAPPSFCNFCKPISKLKVQNYPQVKAQRFGDEVSSAANTVDANLSVLRVRIEEVKKKESFDRCYTLQHAGWTYKPGYDYNHKRQAMLSESIELIGLASGALGLVFLFGSLCIFLVSFLVHLYE